MGLLGDNPGSGPAQPGPAEVFVDSVPSTNSAAKFWPSLVDEVTAAFPRCDRVELSAPSAAPLRCEDLFPSWSLQRELERYGGEDLAQAIQDTMAELALLGAPASVVIRLLAGAEVLFTRDLPADSLDADTFPFFAGWLFAWAGLHHSTWNDASLAGIVRMEDRRRRLAYTLEFDAAYVHLSEGLYRRTVSVTPVRTDMAGR